MQIFWRLLEESVIVQAVITLALVIAVIYLVCTGQPVPELLSSALWVVLGYYFGSKVQQQISATARRAKE